DQKRKATILYTTAELLRVVTELAHPVLPQSTDKIWTLLGQQGSAASQHLDGLRWGQLTPGTQLGKSQTLFPRIDKAEALERMEAMANETEKAPSPVAAPTPAATRAPAAGAAT